MKHDVFVLLFVFVIVPIIVLETDAVIHTLQLSILFRVFLFLFVVDRDFDFVMSMNLKCIVLMHAIESAYFMHKLLGVR